jgi:hypothetical protein
MVAGTIGHPIRLTLSAGEIGDLVIYLADNGAR